MKNVEWENYNDAKHYCTTVFCNNLAGFTHYVTSLDLFGGDYQAIILDGNNPLWTDLKRNWVYLCQDDFPSGVMGYLSLTPHRYEIKRQFNGKSFNYEPDDRAKLAGKKLWFIKSKMKVGEMCLARKMPDYVPQPPQID